MGYTRSNNALLRHTSNNHRINWALLSKIIGKFENCDEKDEYSIPDNESFISFEGVQSLEKACRVTHRYVAQQFTNWLRDDLIPNVVRDQNLRKSIPTDRKLAKQQIHLSRQLFDMHCKYTSLVVRSTTDLTMATRKIAILQETLDEHRRLIKSLACMQRPSNKMQK